MAEKRRQTRRRIVQHPETTIAPDGMYVRRVDIFGREMRILQVLRPDVLSGSRRIIVLVPQKIL